MSLLLLREIAGGLSAGRVLSVALVLIIKREVQRVMFRNAGYTGYIRQLIVGAGDSRTLMQATLRPITDKLLVRGSDFAEATVEQISAATEIGAPCFDGKTIQELLQGLCWDEARLKTLEKRMTTQSLLAPLIRSILQ